MKVTVIMPVYNAAGNLPASLESLKAQTFRDFDVVFVDDCSTDGSDEILRRFAANSGINCRIIRQQGNGGVAAARNTGLENADGEFVAWLDSDDRMAPETLALAVAASDGADIVGWDWTLGFEKNGRHMRQADYSTPLEALKALMGGTMRWNLWLFMVRRSLAVRNGIRFIDGANMGEDMMFMLKAFSVADRVVRLDSALYHYNAANSSSISHQFTPERRREVGRNMAELEPFLKASAYGAQLGDYYQYLKLYVKLPLLLSPDKGDFDIWYRWWPESNPYSASNKALPFRTRLVQWMASRRWKTGVRLYYLIVYKFVYGIVYR